LSRRERKRAKSAAVIVGAGVLMTLHALPKVA
jgi:hypothetical protein